MGFVPKLAIQNYFWRKTDLDRYLFGDAQVPWPPHSDVSTNLRRATTERQNEKV
jgi:hypothetical protein